MGELKVLLILVGLGNPGSAYRGTRHNVGYWLLERLGHLNGFVLRKTDTLMNRSGLAVKRMLDELALVPDNLVVVHDDLDIKLGGFKLQKGRGAAGHKGVQSIINTLGTKNFWRLRIGIGRPLGGFDVERYVLSKFKLEELVLLEELVPVLKQRLATLPR